MSLSIQPDKNELMEELLYNGRQENKRHTESPSLVSLVFKDSAPGTTRSAPFIHLPIMLLALELLHGYRLTHSTTKGNLFLPLNCSRTPKAATDDDLHIAGYFSPNSIEKPR